MPNIVSYDYPTRSTFKDRSGQTFGRLHVDSFHGRDKNYRIYYNCTCECGNKVVASARGLLSGDTKSCGCLYKDTRFTSNLKHGLTNHTLYWIRRAMMVRCYNPKHREYDNYGGRGIEVCNEWRNKKDGFINFYNWAMDNGYRKGLTLDRIDVNGNYSPENCRWADAEIQHSNKRTNRYVSLVLDFTPIGKEKIIYTYTITQWSRITGIPVRSLLRRIIEYKWPVEKALTTDGKVTKPMIIIPEEMLKYNQPDKFDISIHD